MEERQITIDGETRLLAQPFLVIATQNPVETSGTFPLPEAQLDRFIMQLKVGFPTSDEEITILTRFIEDNPLEQLKPVCTTEDLISMQTAIKSIYVHPSIMEYMIAIVNDTRNNDHVALGVSPRGSLALLRASQAYAAILGNHYVTPEIVKYLTPFVLTHRLILRTNFHKTSSAHDLMKTVLDKTPVPTEDFTNRSNK